jgi:hypothetical protein
MLYTPPHILADQLTLSQPLGGGDRLRPQHYYPPPCFQTFRHPSRLVFVFFRIYRKVRNRGRLKISCGIYHRAVCITRNFSEPQNLQFIIKSGFKSRAGYNGAYTVYRSLTLKLNIAGSIKLIRLRGYP